MKEARVVSWRAPDGAKKRIVCPEQAEIHAAQAEAQKDGVTPSVRRIRANGNGNGKGKKCRLKPACHRRALIRR